MLEENGLKVWAGWYISYTPKEAGTMTASSSVGFVALSRLFLYFGAWIILRIHFSCGRLSVSKKCCAPLWRVVWLLVMSGYTDYCCQSTAGGVYSLLKQILVTLQVHSTWCAETRKATLESMTKDENAVERISAAKKDEFLLGNSADYGVINYWKRLAWPRAAPLFYATWTWTSSLTRMHSYSG